MIFIEEEINSFIVKFIRDSILIVLRWISKYIVWKLIFLAVKFRKDCDMIIKIFITYEEDQLFFYEVDEEWIKKDELN